MTTYSVVEREGVRREMESLAEAKGILRAACIDGGAFIGFGRITASDGSWYAFTGDATRPRFIKGNTGEDA